MDNKIMLYEKSIERSLQKQISDNSKDLKLFVDTEIKEVKLSFQNLERSLQKTDKSVLENNAKVERMEKSLREQIAFISKMTDQVQVLEKKLKESEKNFETHKEEIQRQFSQIQAHNAKIKTAVA